ncbi:radical SAM protein [Candidatus Woesearchaeota archaeon]|nr:radical SAM protein [Candidatus Woesearchaeota archaeon]
MLSYDDLLFEEQHDGMIRVQIYNFFFRDISREELAERVGTFRIHDKKIIVENRDPVRVQNKFMQFFRRYKKDLVYTLNQNPAIYVDEDLGLPLVGLNFLGIVDKGSEILELKPITNCNANCVFCSVNEGPSSNKQIDFVVDKDYLVAETKALLTYKGTRGMSLWINPHGEPTLYAKLAGLCSDLLGNEYVKDIHIITNGMLLTKNLVDELDALASLEGKPIHISASLSGLRQQKEESSRFNKEGLPLAKLMMGKTYHVDLVLKNLGYACQKLPITITPVFVHGMNDDEMKNIIQLAQVLSKGKNVRHEVKVMIQKFCKNKRGRNPVKEQSWEEFFSILKNLEGETGTQLLHPLGKILRTKELPVLCKKHDRIQVKILCPGRYHADRLGVLETPQGDRAVTLVGCHADKGLVKAVVVQSKYSMILAKT